MMCILTSKKGLKTLPTDDEYRPSFHTVLLAFLEVFLAAFCAYLVIYVVFNPQVEQRGLTENPVSVLVVNATDPTQRGEVNNATSLASKMSKVSITIDYANTSPLRLDSGFIQLYVMASSCILMGLSLVVMEGGRLLAECSKKLDKFYPAIVDGGVYKEICLDIGSDDIKDKY